MERKAHALLVFLTKEMSTPAMYFKSSKGGTGEKVRRFCCITCFARRVCSLTEHQYGPRVGGGRGCNGGECTLPILVGLWRGCMFHLLSSIPGQSSFLHSLSP